jgi:hypothetical protein
MSKIKNLQIIWWCCMQGYIAIRMTCGL